MKIVVTGANGFIGMKLFHSLRLTGYQVDGITRRSFPGCINLGSISPFTNWGTVLSDTHCVIHTAALAHQDSSSPTENLNEFNRINCDSTINLARQAAKAGVKRLVFLSSIGVNGARNLGQPFSENDIPQPVDLYAKSKFSAEQGLLKISEEFGLEVVIIRPPLVYGKGAPGSFGSLLKLAKTNLPLPLGAIHNKRSFISIDNLVDFIVTCVEHPMAEGKTFLVSDDNDVSTTAFIKSLIKASGKTPYLIPVNVSLLRFIAGLAGKSSMIDKLACDLQIDMSYAKDILGWKPPISLQEGIRRCFADE